MKNLFVIIFFILFIVVIVGLIKPNVVIRWGNESIKTRKKVLMYFGIPLIIVYVLARLTPVNAKTDVQSQYNNNKLVQETQQKEKENVKVKEEPKAVNFGEVGTTDKWQVKVLEVIEPTTIQGNSSGDKPITTQEKFVVIKLELKNISDSPAEYSKYDFRIATKLTTQKSVYEIDDVGFKVLGKLNSRETIYNKNTNFVGIYDKINPGLTKNTYIAFNVPKDLDISRSILTVINNKNDAIFMKVK